MPATVYSYVFVSLYKLLLQRHQRSSWQDKAQSFSNTCTMHGDTVPCLHSLPNRHHSMGITKFLLVDRERHWVHTFFHISGRLCIIPGRVLARQTILLLHPDRTIYLKGPFRGTQESVLNPVYTSQTLQSLLARPLHSTYSHS